MTGKELLEALQTLTPEELALDVWASGCSGYVTRVDVGGMLEVCACGNPKEGAPIIVRPKERT